jgi:TRAP-type C4-dicarboxylate transport system substrate-binding protein
MPSLIRISAAILLAATGISANAAEFEWKFYTFYAPQDPPTVIDRAFAKDVEQATNGRLKITVYAGGELPYKASDTLRILRTGQVEMAHIALGTVAGDLPEANVFSQPFVCTSLAAFYDKALPAIEPKVDNLLQEKFQSKTLLSFSMPPQQFWLSRDVQKIEDFKGLKVRSWNREQIDLMKLLGGSGISITAAEVIPALQRGVVDGAVTAAIPALSWRFHEVIKYGYMANISLSHELVAVNQKALAKLPEDLRKILQDKGVEWAQRYRTGIDEANQSAAQQLTSLGMTLNQPSDQQITQLRELAQPIINDWAAKYGAVAQDMLNDVKQACN